MTSSSSWTATLLVCTLAGCTLTTDVDGLTDGRTSNPGSSGGSSGSSGSAGAAGTSGSAGAGATSGSAGASGTGGFSGTGGSAGTGGTQPCTPKTCPEDVSTGEASPLGITLYGNEVYWVNTRDGSSSEIWKADVSTKIKQRVDTVEDNIGKAFDVGVDSLNVYWSERNTGRIYGRPLGGGQPIQRFTMHWGVGGYISVLNGAVAATDYRQSAPGFNAVQYNGYVITAEEYLAIGVSTSGDKIYWSGNFNKLMATQNFAGAPIVEVTGLPQVTAIWVDGDVVFWMQNFRTIMETHLSAGHTSIRYDAGVDFSVSDIAADATHIYWTENAFGRVRRLER